MADAEQIKILEKGVDAWNRWRDQNPGAKIDLCQAVLEGLQLWGVNFRRTDLDGAILSKSNLREADLRGAVLRGARLGAADLGRADLTGADLRVAHLEATTLREADLHTAHLTKTRLSGADLSRAILWGADLRGADLCEADLSDAPLRLAILRNANLERAKLHGAALDYADLTSASLREADLTEAYLWTADFAGADLTGANLRKASMGRTVLPDSDLSSATGLDEVRHIFPSYLGTETIRRSRGKLPEVFLRGCGLSDWEIASARLYDPDLSTRMELEALYQIHARRAKQRLQSAPLLISYDRNDTGFVGLLEKRLDKAGIRFWHDMHDDLQGWLPGYVNYARYQQAKILLILSEGAFGSEWLERAIASAREAEQKTGQRVLYPVLISSSARSTPWPASILEQLRPYGIPHFTGWWREWEYDGSAQKLDKLIASLQLYDRR